MSIMTAITFWYMEVKSASECTYEKWVTGMAEVENKKVKMGFFCIEDKEDFE